MIIRESHGGKIIGEIDGDTFTKKVDGSIHMLRQPLSWAIDANAYNEYVKPLCKTIVVIDTHANLTYSVGVDTFERKKGFIDRGFGGQYFLTLGHWQCTSILQGKML